MPAPNPSATVVVREHDDQPFYEAKCTTARWFFETLLPEFETRLRVLDAAGADTPTISDLGG